MPSSTRRSALYRHLFVLVIAALLPPAILAAAGLLLLQHQQRDVEQRRAMEITHAMARAVDSELQRSISALQVLAVSAALQQGDMERFRGVLSRAVRLNPRWKHIILADPAGRPLINTEFGPDHALPPTYEMESFREAVRSRAPLVGPLAVGRRSHAFAIRVPVIHDGQVTYVLSAVMDPEGIRQILDKPGTPEDWVVSVFDGNGLRVARSRAHERYLGSPASDSLRQLMERSGDEGMGITQLVEGDPVFSAFSRLPLGGWSVAVGLPVAAVTKAGYRAVAIYGAAMLLSLLAGVGAALVIARRINRPMAALRDGARLLGRGGRPEPPDTSIREIHEVGEAITAAADARHAFEAEREELLRREQAARSAAEEANKAKDEFLAMLAHELRNPLAALSGASSVLTHAPGDAALTQRAGEAIRRQVAHLARLTDDLVDTARALLGKTELLREPIDLAAATRATLDTLESIGRLKNHRLVTHLAPAWVEADRVRLDQVLGNLLVNAVKYTPAGGTVTVRTFREGDDSVLSVADDGPGLSPELAARAFDLFVQGERELEHGQGGLGIGLTLVRRLAELHGGTAAVKSEGLGRGSEFIVRLPAIDAEPHRARESGSAPREWRRQPVDLRTRP
ncbi:MAG TPA: sensor histidine kinase [Usitatibacter sp.]|nr:sensor histidine kinase [Usitatibacter sp.]